MVLAIQEKVLGIEHPCSKQVQENVEDWKSEMGMKKCGSRLEAPALNVRVSND